MTDAVLARDQSESVLRPMPEIPSASMKTTPAASSADRSRSIVDRRGLRASASNSAIALRGTPARDARSSWVIWMAARAPRNWAGVMNESI